jgi:hypothetical protein
LCRSASRMRISSSGRGTTAIGLLLSRPGPRASSSVAGICHNCSSSPWR